jgi:hypothetical protein
VERTIDFDYYFNRIVPRFQERKRKKNERSKQIPAQRRADPGKQSLTRAASCYKMKEKTGGSRK